MADDRPVPVPAAKRDMRASVPLGTLADTVRDVLRTASEPTTPSPDRYLEHHELGRGGMGRVVEARDTWLGRRVAVKHLLGEGSTILRRRFDVEALVTAQLDHPGIPTVYERSMGAGGLPYYTMRLVEGHPLSHLLRQAADFEARMRLLPIVVRVAQTLAFAHERGVIHRDVKPDNVVVGPHGDAVLLDWGIAKVRGLGEARSEDGAATPPGGDGNLTAVGSVLGTPAYMAPEQARGEIDAVDERSDVFALGAMLYHILSGHPPYQAKTLVELLRDARESKSQPIDLAAPKAAEELRAVVSRAMASDPAKRHASAGEFAADLETFMTLVVSRPKSRGVERVVAATAWIGLFLCIGMAVVAARVTPTLHEMGFAAYGSIVLFALGLAVGVFEWATAGRHRLMAVGLGLIGLTVVGAIAGTSMGLINTYRYLLRPEVLNDARQFRQMLVMGHMESLGNIPFAFTLALVQAMVLAFAWRRSKAPAIDA